MDKSLVHKKYCVFYGEETEWIKNMIRETKKWIEFCEIF